MKTVLTIAGSDCSGGAGIQADIKTITAHKLYAMSALTALTAQNTMGVADILDVPPAFLKQQLDCVFTDIPPDAVKVGMASSAALIRVIADALVRYGVKNVVVDPVMVSTSGSRLLQEDAQSALKELLLPCATLVTPNIPEAQVLTGFTIEDKGGMERAAQRLAEEYGCAVLLKGGHHTEDANDLLCSPNGLRWFCGERINNPNTHGTGCTLSSAIACNLAKGQSLEQSVERAKTYLTGALRAGLNLGRGSGPLDHCYMIPELK